MLRTPNFDKSAYNCLNQDLSAVQYWLDLQSLLGKLDEAEAAKVALLNGHTAQHDQLCREVLDQISRECAHQKFRTDRVSALVSRLIHCRQFPQAHSHEISRLLSELLLLYAKFDTDLLKADWADLFGTDGAASEITKLNGKTGGLKKHLGELRKRLPQCFADGTIPERWKGIVAPADSTSPDTQTTLAEIIINRFVLDWRLRAPLFGVPVTIYGTDIHTLGDASRGRWEAAYKALGLAPGLKPTYAAIKSDERRLEKIRSANSQINMSVAG